MMLGGMTYFLHFLTFLPEKNLKKKQKKLNFGGGGGLFWPLLLKKVKKNITSVLVGSDACMLRTEQCNFKFQLLKLRLFKFFFT
jgi:hypothetical protein